MMRSILTLAILVSSLAPVTLVARTESRQTQTAPAATPALNLNAASQAELEKLPGIGPATAKLIIDYRQKNNGFKKVEELMNIKGIGEKSFLKLKPLVTVAAAKTSMR